MNSHGLLPILPVLVSALATAHLVLKRLPAPSVAGRFASIDGLRGYLALAVFLHHAWIWYYYPRSGRWESPEPLLYATLGPCGVLLFFMITAFLFSSKIRDASPGSIDWVRLFLSRCTRLAPMYFFVLALLLGVVAVVSDGQLRQPLAELATQIGAWLTFTILGGPDINGVASTFLIVAGVMWSLPYEWFFYLCLPLLALVLRRPPPIGWLTLGVGAAIAFWIWGPARDPLLAFLAGLAACPLARLPAISRNARHWSTSFAVALLIIAGLAASAGGQPVTCIALLGAAFALIAAGNDLFGVLIAPASRLLGEISYSLYLLHGLMLFVCFSFVVDGRRYSTAMHWAIVTALTPLLIVACSATYRWIEQPAVQRTDSLARWLRTRLLPRPIAAAAKEGG